MGIHATRWRAAAQLAAVVVALAGCTPPTDQQGGGTSTPTAQGREYPGLFPEYRGKFHPNHTDLGGRSNAELASLLPSGADFPGPGATRGPDIASEDGSGLGLHGQTDGETRPPECLYTPFGKSFSRAPDGSDWNLYYAASTLHETDAPGNHVIVTVSRERENADAIALTEAWIKKCAQYDRAFPTFAKPENRNRHVVDTFDKGPVVGGVQTYLYTSTSTGLDDASANLPGPPLPNVKRIVLARVRSVVFQVEGTDQVPPDVLDGIMATTIDNAQNAPPTADKNIERLGGLGDCGSVPVSPGGQPDPALDCVIRTDDGSGIIFEVLGTPAGTIRVFDSDGAQRQIIREPNALLAQRLPQVVDVDKDKREELLVTTQIAGGGNELTDIWRARPGVNQFIQFDMTGTVFGVPRFLQTPDHFTGIHTPVNSNVGSVTLFRFVDNKLVTLAILDTERRLDNGPLGDPKWKLNGNVKCALNTSDIPPGAFGARTDAVRAAGLDPASADEHFCMQQWVTTLYRQ